mmetsp:Transcript_79321/g.140350  ORF Transcript_79321/g.140350 Transcript_79321/m.140350 type:complete len:349 (+) Transcript_79321:83-1129(+)
MATSLNMLPVMDVSEALIVKNTFLDVMEPAAEAPARRCSSVPRSWMPGKSRMDSSCAKPVAGEHSPTFSDKEALTPSSDLDSLTGEDSTTASDKETLTASSDLDSLTGSDKDMHPGASTPSTISEFDYLECVECGSELAMNSCSSAAPKEMPTCKPVVEVKLLDFVGDAAPARPAPVTRTKLRATAQPFASVRAPPAGIQKVIQAAKDVLECDPSVGSVQMVEGAMGGTWTMIAHLRADAPKKNPRYYLSAAKNTLLTSAEHSRDTYVLGYDVKPFSKIDKCSFSTTLATIPDAQQNIACWDSYKNGCCPRRITCRWAHPSETQVMRLVIRVQHADEAVGVREAHEEQ